MPKKWLICTHSSTTTGLLGLGPVPIDSSKLALSFDTKIRAQLGPGASPSRKRGLDRYQPPISPFGCRHSSPRQRWPLLSKEREREQLREGVNTWKLLGLRLNLWRTLAKQTAVSRVSKVSAAFDWLYGNHVEEVQRTVTLFILTIHHYHSFIYPIVQSHHFHPWPTKISPFPIYIITACTFTPVRLAVRVSFSLPIYGLEFWLNSSNCSLSIHIIYIINQ